MSVAVIKTTWTGGPSSPGLTQFVVQTDGTSDIDAAQAAVFNFWFEVNAKLAGGYTLQVEQLSESFDETTGQLIGEQNATNPQAAIVNTTAAFGAGVGCRIDWKTFAIRNGRRVRGRTFLVPCKSSLFDSTGTLTEVAREEIRVDAQALVDALDANLTPLVVWSRPSTANPVGQASPVQLAMVPDKPAWLSGRRD